MLVSNARSASVDVSECQRISGDPVPTGKEHRAAQAFDALLHSTRSDSNRSGSAAPAWPPVRPIFWYGRPHEIQVSPRGRVVHSLCWLRGCLTCSTFIGDIVNVRP